MTHGATRWRREALLGSGLPSQLLAFVSRGCPLGTHDVIPPTRSEGDAIRCQPRKRARGVSLIVGLAHYGA